MARPRTVRTPRRRQVIIQALRAGATRRVAAERSGIGVESLRLWLIEDIGLADEVRRAQADWQLTQVARLGAAAARGDSRAAIWLLGHHPETRGEWGESARSTVVIEGGSQPVRVNAEVTVPSVTERLASLAKTLDVLARIGVIPFPSAAGLSVIRVPEPPETPDHNPRTEEDR